MSECNNTVQIVGLITAAIVTLGTLFINRYFKSLVGEVNALRQTVASTHALILRQDDNARESAQQADMKTNVRYTNKPDNFPDGKP